MYLCDNVLSINTAVQSQLLRNVCERDPRVGERDHPDSCLDDIVTETDNEGVGPFALELCSVAI